mmetsp:Transcript_43178/g.109055  ORF Transcript_43178/g.109055 Transcript_43178/m.109055 type:complete len:594 (+) Transcript_43178:171-1952(+)
MRLMHSLSLSFLCFISNLSVVIMSDFSAGSSDVLSSSRVSQQGRLCIPRSITHSNVQCQPFEVELSDEVTWQLTLSLQPTPDVVLQIVHADPFVTGSIHSPCTNVWKTSFPSDPSAPTHSKVTFHVFEAPPAFFYPHQKVEFLACAVPAPAASQYPFTHLTVQKQVQAYASAYVPYSDLHCASYRIIIQHLAIFSVVLRDEFRRPIRTHQPNRVFLAIQHTDHVFPVNDKHNQIIEFNDAGLVCVQLVELDGAGAVVVAGARQCIYCIPLWMWVLLACVVVLAVGGVLVLVCYKLYKRWRREREKHFLRMFPMPQPSSHSQAALAPPFPKGMTVQLSDLEIVRDMIGSGGQANIALGLYKGLKVCLKKYREESQDFRTEAEALFHLRHPNVVLVLGAMLTPPILLLEFMERGSLQMQLQVAPHAITDERALGIARDCALGMLFIHLNNMLHLDLKSGNILLDTHYHAKITDFGISRPTSALLTKGINYGTPRWMAPELMHHDPMHCTPAADVYSYCTVLSELASRTTPPYQHCHFDHEIVEAALRGEHPTLPCNCPPWVCIVTREGWNLDPHQRPTFEWIVAQLENAHHPHSA